jgi:hypothetical protein
MIAAFNSNESEESGESEEILQYPDVNEGSGQNREGTDMEMGDGGGSDDDESH